MSCFVIEDFTKHITVKGIMYYFLRNCNKKKVLEKVVDPTKDEVDHANINKGIGLILGSAAICKVLHKVNILMENTIFGVVISGSVPDALCRHVVVV